MSVYFVSSAGSNTAPYDTWTKAATSLSTALAAATSAGDIVVIKYNGVPAVDSALTTDKTYTFAAPIALISASADDANTAYTPTPMGASGRLGYTDTVQSGNISFAGGHAVFCYGLTVEITSIYGPAIKFAQSDNAYQIFESCLIKLNASHAAAFLQIGISSVDYNCGVKFRNCDFYFGNAGHGLQFHQGTVIMEGCTVLATGAAPTKLWVDTPGGMTVGAAKATHFGCDFSYLGAGSYLVGAMNASSTEFVFTECKFGALSGVLAAQSRVNQSAVSVEVRDCSANDEHYHYQYHNVLGSLTVDTSIYLNDGASYDGSAKCSWKIVTTANASFWNPFITPWISKFHSATAAITPRLEALRSGSATAYKDDQVWADFSCKTTSGSTLATIVSDRRALGGVGADQGASSKGAGDWQGEAGSAWFGKLEAPSPITPAEIGDLAARVCVGAPSATVYIDPQIRVA